MISIFWFIFLKHFFLHLFQIRRIAIVIFSVASGRLGLGEVKRMLNGEKKNWPLGLDMADPNGLYLGNHHVFLDSWVDCGNQRTWKLVDYKIFNYLTSGKSNQSKVNPQRPKGVVNWFWIDLPWVRSYRFCNPPTFRSFDTHSCMVD